MHKQLNFGYWNVAYLAAQVDQIGIGVVQREHDSIAGVQLHHNDGFVEMFWRTKRVLPLAHFTEARRENQPAFHEDGLRRFCTLVTNGFLESNTNYFYPLSKKVSFAVFRI